MVCLYVTVWLTKGIYKGIFTMKASHDILSQDVLGKEINSNRPPRDKFNPKFPVIIKREAKGKTEKIHMLLSYSETSFLCPRPNSQAQIFTELHQGRDEWKERQNTGVFSRRTWVGVEESTGHCQLFLLF